MTHRRLVVLAVVLAAGCAAMSRLSVPPKLAGVPVPMWKHELRDQTGSVLFARNDSTVTLSITFRLFDCVNVKNTCGEIPPERTLAPDEYVVVDTIWADSLALPYRFNYAYRAR